MITVLLIEDNLEIRENTTEILEMEGYEVEVAHNGMIGINMAKQILPDIILCDIMMPEADGWEVIKQLKRDRQTALIPFIFITASVEKREIEEGLKLGADGYLNKPFEPNQLLELIKNAFNAGQC